MLTIDVGNTLRWGLRTGIQRVVRALAFELATIASATTRLIVFDPSAQRYFALADPALIRTADSLADVSQEARDYFDLDIFAAGDVFFEPDAAWSEPVSRGALFRALKAKGVIVVVLNHDVIPFLLPQFFPANTLVSFAETIADHLQYADYALATSPGVARDLRALSERFLGRSMTTRVIKLGADLTPPLSAGDEAATTFAATFPELAGLRFLLAVGTVEPRKNQALLLQAFDRLDAKDAGLVIAGRRGWMAEEVVAALTSHPAFGKRVFWYADLDDEALRALYRNAYASVVPSHYEGYGLPVVEALSQGCATVTSDAGSLPEVAAGCAEVFPLENGEALFAIIDRLYGDPRYHAALKEKASRFQPTSWKEAGESVARALEDIVTGASHDFAAPVRQMVYLSIHPEILDLSLASVRANLPFIDRVVILTSPGAKEAIDAVARRHFPAATILTDDTVAGGDVPGDHQGRNTWLRKKLYEQDAIEANFLAADEDAIALRPLERDHFQKSDVHVAYYFQEDGGTWLAGSPSTTSYDRGLRQAWRLLREAAYPARAFSSHMPQVINKSLANEIYDRFVMDAEHAGYDEWSLYFNTACQLYPRHVHAEPYGTLGWPMRPGDWLPELLPRAPAFENYYPANYEPGGLFAGLSPLGDLEAKTQRTLAALAQASHAETGSAGQHTPGILGVVVTAEALKFVGTGTVLAGKDNVRRVLVVNGTGDSKAIKGKLEMFVTEPRGALVRGESIALGEVCWMPLLPPEAPGLYPIRFFATLDSGARLEARGLLTVIADKESR
jgi:glycosyltransferase involved in cell wall biosynthesis